MRRTTAAYGLSLVLALAASGCGGGTAAGPDESDSRSAGPSASSTPTPSATETPVVAQPVWYDDAGLHRGTAVEKTPVPLIDKGAGTDWPRRKPSLALVRTGAVYRDPATDDIWFHPWGGTPQVVGHGSRSGPGGDPEGDVAAWFEGWHLVVYDTARGKQISRTREVAGVEPYAETPEHVGHGNGFVHVAAHQVVWQSPEGLGRRDLAAGTTQLPWHPRPPTAVRPGLVPSPRFLDVSGASAAWAAATAVDSKTGEAREALFLDGPGAATRPITGLESSGRLSPDGSWLITAEIGDGTHGVAVVDVRTGEAWKPFAKPAYAFFSWAYGDVVVMRVQRGAEGRGPWSLVACHAERRTCATLPSKGDVLLPNP